ncbi:FAD-binding protein [Ktedonospora formicarum]|uniref:UDP-N-acetylenolpyruvoylglucosamine reductase n=1 Tax=Ktedonospora formicarum TaxID=2778364 RepID=A0A8J3I6B9_9CHLR|nr:FAD-binding protein [Ktedonospora formicarum]GHO48211.1 UDP-N-acetylenolpyruvoylglucosamine reductase [Ktedonospora formicarum]
MNFPIDTAYSVLSACFPGALRRNEPLSLHCAIGIGGPADLWLPLRTRAELIHLVHLCAEHHFQLLLVGNGTNTIYPDEGVRGIVGHVTLNSHTIERDSHDTALLDVDSGTRWRHLVEEIASEGWGGIEFGLGIPGSLGGALVTNTGAHNRELGTVVEWVDILDARGANSGDEDSLSPPLMVRYTHDEIDFSYRTCRMRSHRLVTFDQRGRAVCIPRALIEPPEVVVALGLRVRRVDIDALRETIQRFRQSHMPTITEQFQTDSIFIDVPDYRVHELIENVGLQEARCGQAQVAPGKLNAIRNLGGATARDALNLIELLHREILIRTGIDLPLDVELLAFA